MAPSYKPLILSSRLWLSAFALCFCVLEVDAKVRYHHTSPTVCYDQYVSVDCPMISVTPNNSTVCGSQEPQQDTLPKIKEEILAHPHDHNWRKYVNCSLLYVCLTFNALNVLAMQSQAYYV